MGDEDQPIWRRAATHTLHSSLILKASLEERLQEQTGLLLADNEALLNLSVEGSMLRMSEIARRLILTRVGHGRHVVSEHDLLEVAEKDQPGARAKTRPGDALQERPPWERGAPADQAPHDLTGP